VENQLFSNGYLAMKIQLSTLRKSISCIETQLLSYKINFEYEKSLAPIVAQSRSKQAIRLLPIDGSD
jgi:hypothetical protein